MSSVDIRVDLPSYSRSFIVCVEPQATIRQVKQEIHLACPGQPRPEGQRLIWRGRILLDDESVDNLWKLEPRIVHLAVHPSAWSSPPPEIPVSQTRSQSPLPSSIRASSEAYSPDAFNTLSATDFTTQPLRPTMAYVIYQHQTALSTLSPSIPRPSELEAPALCRLTAKEELERHGWAWPSILDQDFPAHSEGGLSYESTSFDNQPYLRLLNPGEKATKIQEHALRVLTFTFTILTMTLLPSPTARNVPTQSITIPPHVNQLLQQMGLPPLRVANNNIVQPVANPNNPALPEMREIRLRPLLAPLIMLVFRTMLLLYFVAPARKPIFGILILAWMLYEIWQPIQNGLRNGFGRLPGNQRRMDNAAAGQAQNNNAPPQANVPPPNGMRNPAADLPARANIIGGNLDQQAAALFDTLANMNIAEEERQLNAAAGVSATEPGFGHKISTFIGLFITTLHPAIWNRRRTALRRREGTVRTEANIRNAPPPTEGESQPTPSPGEERATQMRDEMRAQFNRRPRWIQRYMERVVAEEWVDDSD